MFSSKKIIVIIIGITFSIIIIDFLKIDNLSYLNLCHYVLSPNNCPKYYDLPLWEVLTSIGTVSAGLFAYLAINQQNKQLYADQIPIVVAPYGINFDLTAIQVKNIGKGVALKVFATSDAHGRKSIHSHFSPSLLYITPETSMKGLETVYTDAEKLEINNNEVVFYIHYNDSENNTYKTISTFAVVPHGHSRNIVCKDNEVYQLSPKKIKLL